MKEKAIRGRGPDPKYGEKSVVKSVRMPPSLWADLLAVADRDETTANELIVRTMLRKCNRELR